MLGLPDDHFAYINYNTNKRYFPHHQYDGAISKLQLRMAISRICHDGSWDLITKRSIIVHLIGHTLEIGMDAKPLWRELIKMYGDID